MVFYHDVALRSGWKPAYEAYMRIQLALWADETDKRLLRQHFTESPQITKATQQFLRAIEHNSGKGKRLTHTDAVQYFSAKENWKTVAEELTKALEPFIQPGITIPICGFGKRMAEQMHDPVLREKFARRNYEEGKTIPPWMTKIEALDAVYSSQAREIQIKVTEPKKSRSLPVVPYQHEPFDPAQDAVREVNFRRLQIVPERETPFGLPAVTFGVPRQHIERPLLVKAGITSFPEFKCAYIDSSGTMKYGIPDAADAGSTTFIPWGDKSRYHYLCKAWYGIVEYLGRQGILPNVQIAMGSFSTSSRISHGLQAAKELLFSPTFLSTNIAPDDVEELLKGGKSVFFTVSDGEVQNWRTTYEVNKRGERKYDQDGNPIVLHQGVDERFIAAVKQHRYFHIQIGPETEMTKALRESGLRVYSVQSGPELEQMAIDLTHNEYQAHIDDIVGRLR